MRLTSLSLFISSPSFSLWLQDTCHLMPFTKYSLLDQSYFFTSCLSIAHIKFTNKIHQLFTDYLLRLPYSELLETHLFRSRANRRLVLYPGRVTDLEVGKIPPFQNCFYLWNTDENGSFALPSWFFRDIQNVRIYNSCMFMTCIRHIIIAYVV